MNKDGNSKISSIRLRIENQFYESQKFKTLIGNQNGPTVGWDNKIDYLMMRRQKVDEDPFIEEEEEGQTLDG